MLEEVIDLARSRGVVAVPVCAKIEAEISELDADDRDEFLRDLGLAEPGLDRVVRAGYRLLGLHHYFTAGPKEARAWDDSGGHIGAGRGWRHPHRLRARLHSRRSGAL